MKKFIFRLETLLSVRRTREGAMKRDLEYAHQKWSQAKEKEEMLQTQIEALLEEIQKKRLEGKIHLHETYEQILEHLNTSLTQVQNSLALQQRQLDEQKERLKQAVQERKVIEKIKEKHYAGWRKVESQSEGALLDEIALKKPVEFK